MNNIMDEDPLSTLCDDLSEEIPEGGTAKAKRLDNSDAEFWPVQSLNSRITANIVQQVFCAKSPDYDSTLVNFVVDDAKKLFAITAHTANSHNLLLDRMQFFKSNGITDNDLDAEIESSDSRKAPSADKNSPSLVDKLASLDLSGKLWRSTAKSQFSDYLWKAASPVFSTSRSNYNFKASTILPFSKLEPNIKGGAFSTVHKVAIYEGYYKDDAVSREEWPKYFAVKEIRPPDQREKQLIAQLWDGEADMLRKVNKRSSEHIVRFITAFTRGDAAMGKSYYLMFEWADGGSLADAWKKHPNPVLTSTLMKQAVKQLLGLAKAIYVTHNEDKGGTRHGDLKPENILRFRPDENNVLGTLKIGDWGLAKYHDEATIARKDRTTTRFLTVLYEAPEWGLNQPLGRQYDIWSIGVIILELIIWLLYGFGGVQRFKDEVMGSNPKDPDPCYTTFIDLHGQKNARLKKVVVGWMEHIANDPSCDKETAMSELLALTKTKLLVVDLPAMKAQTVRGDFPTIVEPTETRGTDDPNLRTLKKLERATSEEFVRDLEGIHEEEDVEDYWFKAPPQGYNRQGPPKVAVKAPQDEAGYLTTGMNRSRQVSRERSLASDMSRLGVQEQSFLDYKHPKLDDEWEFHVDNHFASTIISLIKDSPILGLPEPNESARLCDPCQTLDFFSPLGLSIKYDSSELEDKARNCDLCRLFWRTYQRNDGNRTSTVKFEKYQSSLRMNGRGFPALSIFCSNESKAQPGIQIGLPRLPRAGSPTHFEIVRQWLRLCDDKSKHPLCNASDRQPKCLPTRLIDVGRDGEEYVRLRETEPNDTAEYIALSHPWGHGPHFVTNVINLAQHKEGIKVADLPSTFRDAIITTRALQQRYLWIDSICIIQGPGGDFANEAKKMETVFSSAYCVIAASRAHRQTDGFLQGPREREFVTIQKGADPPFYICENIDNFDLHVLNGHLSKRGWVLQEHVLARRTVFFTEDQTYWECGDGVRCETLTKMSNNLASFLGDPNFPRIIMSASQGEKIIRFQSLYKTYSSLGLTNPYDRPIAIDGLENRLLRAFGAAGGFGVFEEDKVGQGGLLRRPRSLLRRSLLWYRPVGKVLNRISYPPGGSAMVPPSWSWMAYIGEIDYLRLEFGNVDWKELSSPWSRGSGSETSLKDPQNANIALSGEARAITLDIGDEMYRQLYFDELDGVEASALHCVVLGVEQGSQPLYSKTHYFILIAPRSSHQRDRSEVYERIGAGYLPGKCISPKGQKVRIH